VRMVVVVADPDAAFARAVKAGATVVWPVIFWPINVWPIDDKAYGWHVGRIVDPFGHHRKSASLWPTATASLGLLPGS